MVFLKKGKSKSFEKPGCEVEGGNELGNSRQ